MGSLRGMSQAPDKAVADKTFGRFVSEAVLLAGSLFLIILGINFFGAAAGFSLGPASFFGLDQGSVGGAILMGIILGVSAVVSGVFLLIFMVRRLKASEGWSSTVFMMAGGIWFVTMFILNLSPISLIIGVILLIFGIREYRANRQVIQSMQDQGMPG